MLKKSEATIKKLLYEIISAAVITYSVVPGFNLIGNLFLQVLVTAFIVFAFLIVSDSKKIKPTTVSRSLIFLVIYWVSIALIKQISLQKKYSERPFSWYFTFYYDKPALIIVAFFAVALFYAFKLIKNSKCQDFIAEYKKFQKTSLITFLVYYALILIYCFCIIRIYDDPTKNFNLIPFQVFSSMKAGDFEYEFIFLFFGNIAIFMPLGILAAAFLKKKFTAVIYLLPFVISISIEVSQYLIGNGHADIDDVILNVFGYFIGFFTIKIFNRILKKCTKGEFESIFLL